MCEYDEVSRGNMSHKESSVFVDGRDRNTIMHDMEARIDRGDMRAERAEAIKVGVHVLLCSLYIQLTSVAGNVPDRRRPLPKDRY